jgi:hypothetical protein
MHFVTVAAWLLLLAGLLPLAATDWRDVRTCIVIVGNAAHSLVTADDLERPQVCCIARRGWILEPPSTAVSFGNERPAVSGVPIEAYVERNGARLPLSVPLQGGDWLGIARSTLPAGATRVWLTIPYVLVPPSSADQDRTPCLGDTS